MPTNPALARHRPIPKGKWGCGAAASSSRISRDQVVDHALSRELCVRICICRHDDPAAQRPRRRPRPGSRFGHRGYRLPRAGVSSLGIPAAPAHAGEASLVGRKRPPGLPLIGGDDVLRLPDFLLEFGNRLLRLAGPARLGAGSPTVNLAVSMFFKVSRSFLSWARCQAMALSLSTGMQTLLIRGQI